MASYVKSDAELELAALVTLSKCVARRAGAEVDHLDEAALAAFHAEHEAAARALPASLQKEYELRGPDDTRYFVKFIDQRMTSIKNSKEVGAFLDAHRDARVIVVMRDWAQRVVKLFLEYPGVEVFQLLELQVDVTEHFFQPYFQVVRDKDELLEAHDNIKLSSYPKLRHYDPVARYFGLRPGDVVRVRRPSIISGYAIIYREVVPQDIADIFGD